MSPFAYQGNMHGSCQHEKAEKPAALAAAGERSFASSRKKLPTAKLFSPRRSIRQLIRTMPGTSMVKALVPAAPGLIGAHGPWPTPRRAFLVRQIDAGCVGL
jgi:hypothetical protein